MLSPDPLIMDGKINKTALARITKDEVWLVEELKNQDLQMLANFFLYCILKMDCTLFRLKKEIISTRLSNISIQAPTRVEIATAYTDKYFIEKNNKKRRIREDMMVDKIVLLLRERA